MTSLAATLVMNRWLPTRPRVRTVPNRLRGDSRHITARIGAGLAHRSVADRWEAEDVSSVRFLDDLLDRFPVTVDGELSLG